jgi:signal transduction histidine kinase
MTPGHADRGGAAGDPERDRLERNDAESTVERFPTESGGRSRSIRWRVLAIVLIPCTALLIIGVGAAGYLIRDASDAKSWSDHMLNGIDQGIAFTRALQEERRLSLLLLGGDGPGTANLGPQRDYVNELLARTAAQGETSVDLNPDVARDATEELARLMGQLPAVRERIDRRQISSEDAYTFYNQLMDLFTGAAQRLARSAHDPRTAAEESTVAGIFRIVDGMSRSNAIGLSAVTSGGLTADQFREYLRRTSEYHAQLESVRPHLTDRGRIQYAELTGTAEWKRLTAMEDALIERGPRPPGATDNRPLPVSIQEWQDSASTVHAALSEMSGTHHQYAQELAEQASDRTLYRSLLAGGGVLVLVIVVLLIAARLSRTLIGRLKRLRAQTLSLADEQLPEIVRRLRGGERIDLDAEVPSLPHGRDEIGQVADAFTKAQHTAVAAAAQEAKVREGLAAVFLNIAHRSQVVVHRQLEVLDEAEGKQEDPEHLELLFRLDHLATRARRNAENLVILAGGQPGRQWRNPVSLVEIVRSAVSETEDFVRVNTAQLPDIAIVGTVVADTIHLLAELVDNATSFSPPESKVTVRGNIVGKGVVIEVEDQGLGITPDKRDEFNAILHDPPDFDVIALSEETRLGLFVVARLATKHGLTVRLSESVYGGVHAIVLIPANFIAPRDGGTGDVAQAGPAGPGWAAETPRPGHSRQIGDVFAVGQGSGNGGTELAEPERAAGVVWPEENPRTAHDRPGRHAQVTGDPHPPLPRRRRQANLSPLLRTSPPARPGPATGSVAHIAAKSPEQARDSMSAFQRGTRSGRQVPHQPRSMSEVREREGDEE